MTCNTSCFSYYHLQFRDDLAEYNRRVKGHTLKFTDVEISQVKRFLKRDDSAAVAAAPHCSSSGTTNSEMLSSDTYDEASGGGRGKSETRINFGPSTEGGTNLYVPQLTYAKLGDMRPILLVYTSKKDIAKYLKPDVDRLYSKYKAEYMRIIVEKMNAQRQEKKKLEKKSQLSINSEEDIKRTKKLISAVDEHLLNSPRQASKDGEVDLEFEERMKLLRLQRSTLSSRSASRDRSRSSSSRPI